MAVTIYLRCALGRPLTFGELDANFDNLKNAIENLGLDDLTDVIITTGATAGSILVYNGSNWVSAQKNIIELNIVVRIVKVVLFVNIIKEK